MSTAGAMIIGIDQGTTGTLGILMDLDGAVHARRYLAHEQHHPKPGWVEHDAGEIASHVENIAQELAARTTSMGRAVAGIGLANQGETVVAWNRATSEPVGHAIVWQDTRTQSWIDEIATDDELSAYVAQTTGLHLDSYFSAGKMRWVLQHVPKTRELAEKDELCLGTLDAWLRWRLTAGRSFVTDASTAARTQLMSLDHLDYDERLLELFGVPRSCLAPIVDCGHRSEARGMGADLDGVPIAASLVDQPAAMFGHGCLRSGQTKATYGTGCFVYQNAGASPPRAAEGLLSTIAWTREPQRVHALDGGVIAVGSLMTWLEQHAGILGDARRIDDLLASHEPNPDVICVTAHAGLGSPIWDRRARGAWLGMDLATGRPDLIHSVLEGIAFRVSQVIDAMESASGATLESLRADGGLVHCRTLMQLQADLLQKPIEVIEEPEATALGIAAFAARSLDLWGDDERVTSRVHVAETFTPQWASDRRARRVATLQGAQNHVRAWGAR